MLNHHQSTRVHSIQTMDTLEETVIARADL